MFADENQQSVWQQQQTCGGDGDDDEKRSLIACNKL